MAIKLGIKIRASCLRKELCRTETRIRTRNRNRNKNMNMNRNWYRSIGRRLGLGLN